jgi:hypothetical protein
MEQWIFKPAPDRWPIAEILEHMVVTQDYILGPVRKQLTNAPAPGERDTKRVDEIVIDHMPDRTAKFRLNFFNQPAGAYRLNA